MEIDKEQIDKKPGIDVEVGVLARLNHHNLVTLFDAGSDVQDPQQPQVYLVMELIEGANLLDRIAEGPLPPLDVAQIGYDIAGGGSIRPRPRRDPPRRQAGEHHDVRLPR